MNRKTLRKWFADGGDKTHRLNYNLNENSIVMDVGGYKGDWSEKIYNLYKPNIYIFEPVSEFYKICEDRFKNYNLINVFMYGLSSESKMTKISIDNDSSSTHKLENENTEICYLSDIINFLNDHKLESVDLIKINIEGDEYDLLEHILLNNKQTIFKNIQVQFHEFIDNSIERRKNIQNILEHTHKLTYNYDFVWENWELKNDK